MNIKDLTAEECRNLIYEGGHWLEKVDENGEEIQVFKVIENKISGTTRWEIWYDMVVQNLLDSTYWMTHYGEGATEQQDTRPWEYSDPKWIKVIPKEKIVIEYTPISQSMDACESTVSGVF